MDFLVPFMRQSATYVEKRIFYIPSVFNAPAEGVTS